MVGENRIPVEWKEITAENIVAENFSIVRKGKA